MKIIKNFQPKIVIFTAVKYCSILHGRIFVMKQSYRFLVAAAKPWRFITADSNQAVFIFLESMFNGPDLKLFILFGWDRSFCLLLGPPGLN